ncbi:vacuolar protein sorting-associated protein [Anaeramoeba ignava]|uniref:Vacuolar protein sorting-associated protein n=1 Tax=Anaeramoeba ignava TaxID=1746090 RepID=A0A9Q0LG91_ANAIG|nr:vacuolar protein sorting-associated protein [Anaeramoeba ignava]
MNIYEALKNYISNMLSEVQGMKVLVLDHETTGIISLIYSQSELLQKQVFLVDKLEKQERETLTHLKGLIFIRPERQNIIKISEELQNPKYGEYHIFFSNIIQKNQLEELAKADTHKAIHQVQEFYADYHAVNPDLFALNIPSVNDILTKNPDKSLITRIAEGIASVCLSLKKNPVIRYQSGFETTHLIAAKLYGIIKKDQELFDFRRKGSRPLLLILDRRSDPVTPLLNQWTYQAMVHEMFGVEKNIVSLKSVVGMRKDMQEIVLSPYQDEFYRDNMFLNFGELGDSMKQLVEGYSETSKFTQNIQTIEDMKRFVEQYPEFKKISGNVTKHVTLVSEISRNIDVKSLFEVSELEQSLATTESHKTHYEGIERMIEKYEVSKRDALRLALLYALRYQNKSNNKTSTLIESLHRKGVSSEKLRLLTQIVLYAGSQVRPEDIFYNKNILSMLRGRFKKSLKDVESIYTQHTTLLAEIIDKAKKNKLSETSFPFISQDSKSNQEVPLQNLIVFFVGGATYEEATAIHEFNSKSSPLIDNDPNSKVHISQVPKSRSTQKSINSQLDIPLNVILGGNWIHNSKSFLKEVAKFKPEKSHKKN